MEPRPPARLDVGMKGSAIVSSMCQSWYRANSSSRKRPGGGSCPRPLTGGPICRVYPMSCSACKSCSSTSSWCIQQLEPTSIPSAGSKQLQCHFKRAEVGKRAHEGGMAGGSLFFSGLAGPCWGRLGPHGAARRPNLASPCTQKAELVCIPS